MNMLPPKVLCYMYIPDFVKIGPVVLSQEVKMFTDDDRRQPIAIGYLSDSGDLKN